MHYIGKAGLLLALTGLMLGCAVGTNKVPPADVKNREAGFVYGYVEADNDFIERVDILEYGKIYVPPFQMPPRVLVFDNGMFMAENIPPGRYVISSFRSDRNNYNMVRDKRHAYQRIFRVEPGEMEYVGSFNLRVTRKGVIEFGDFKVTEILRPGEREVLRELYHLTEGTAWQNRIARRLKELYQ